MKWKTLSSEYIFHDSWLKARKDTCERPDGKIVTPYYVMEYTTWVAGLGITEDNKIVLIKQYRHALGEICIELPGGCVDDTDPDNDFAIKREMLEETGYEFNQVKYLGRISANPSTNSNLLHMYLLQGGKLVQTQALDSNEDIEVFVVTFEELLEMLDKNEILQAMHVSAIYYALKHLGKLKIVL